VWAQGKCQNPVDADWAKYDVDVLATELAPKENQSRCSQISNLQTKKSVYDSAVVLAQYYPLFVREQTNSV